MKKLLVATTLIEAVTGLALLGFPAATVDRLLGPSLGESLPAVVFRGIGALLLALGIVCWFASRDTLKPCSRRMVKVMSVYNPGGMVFLCAVGMSVPKAGVLLWPAVALHAAMTAWCVVCLMKKRPSA